MKILAFSLLALAVLAGCNAEACDEATASRCHENALCDTEWITGGIGCFCPEGFIGTGCTDDSSLDCGGGQLGCNSNGWSARVTFDVTGKSYVPDSANKITGVTNDDKSDWADWFGQSVVDKWTYSSVHHSLSTVWVRNPDTNMPEEKMHLTINMLFADSTSASTAATTFNNNIAVITGVNGIDAPLVSDGAKVYTWKAQSTSAPIGVQATGMTVDFVTYDPSCMDSGCWVVDVTYTKGDATGNFNTFYLPRVQDTEGAGWQEDFSYDRVYADDELPGLTFFPNNFPCGSNVKGDPWDIPVNGHTQDDLATVDNPHTTSCCIPHFLDKYRPTDSFSTYFADVCQGDVADYIESPQNEQPDGFYSVAFPYAQPFDDDTFAGVNANVTYVEPLDVFIGQHKAKIFMDEADLRRRAGQLKGTVGVEYTVDTFIGYANFRPTGSYVLDAAAMQVALHLEKTNFFTVSTQGENAYTFLEYVNMRLVTIYKEDVVFGGESEEGSAGKTFDTNFYETSSEGSADYVQVTFTMGSQYSPNLNGGVFDGGLIPLSSVRAGQGTFFSSAEMEHMCLTYLADPTNFGDSNGGGFAPPITRRSETMDSDSQATRRTERRAARRNDEETDGPLDTCSEQSKCMYMEWNQLRDGDRECTTGECEWEVCIVFSDAHDQRCKVYDYDAWEWSTCLSFSSSSLSLEAVDCQECSDLGLVPGPTGTQVEGNLVCTPALVEGRGDQDETNHYGNIYQWCDKTADACPADTDYPKLEVEYFALEPRQNISRGSKMCQRGKPGQKLFFVMQDGARCRQAEAGDTFFIPAATKALWGDIGHAFPESAFATCEGRDEAVNQCPPCETVGDRLNVDGTAPCGCSLDVDDEQCDESGNCVPTEEVIGFDSCTGIGNTNEDLAQASAECVWTVRLPDNCGQYCPEGEDKETGECNGGGGSSSGCSLDPFDECCGTFNERLCQACAPDAKMCVSPESVPDNFVSFNIPLGIDWYPDPSDSLSENVFVHMVVNALDSSGCANPNSGCDPKQVKTTLFGSIPVVTGGLNIFCDTVRAKTDLKDVADADIVVGTAESEDELSRLRILTDIASTSLNKFEDTTVIDSDSIESGFLTFIVKGNSSYFDQSTTDGYGLELEDLITIHIMEPGTEAFDFVQGLLDTPPSDNYDTTTNAELLVDGYELNGAFRFSIDRMENRAFLEPSEALLAECPFNPVRGDFDVPFPVTCVTRRDVRHRGFPHRPGAYSTAMEVVPLDDAGECGGENKCDTDCTVDQNELFMRTVLGASDYTDQLGRDFSCVIAKKWQLDGRYKRAWWINPGYEWTPTQTGGQSKFTVSQKIFLFALVNLNEKFGAPSSPVGASVDLPGARRRVLLSNRRSNTDKTGAGLSGQLLEYEVDRSTLMANAFDVPIDKVATWKVTVGLTKEAACMGLSDLQKDLKGKLNDIALKFASSFDQLLITSIAVDHDGLTCEDGRRSIARQLLANPTATVEMMIVFKAGPPAMFDETGFRQATGDDIRIEDIEQVKVSERVSIDPPAGIDNNDDNENGNGGSSGNKVAIIVGCVVGGVLALSVLVVGAVMAWRRPAYEAEVASALPDLASLKSQLADESRA